VNPIDRDRQDKGAELSPKRHRRPGDKPLPE
jgi:hypothetical protein